MRFRISQAELARGLDTVSRAAAKTSTLPILKHVALHADDGLTLKTTNFALGIETKIEAEVEKQGGITVPFGLFSEFVKLMPDEPIVFHVSGESQTLSLVCNKNEATFKGMPHEDFPALEFEEGGPFAEFAPGDLRQSIEKTTISAATEENRPVLTGVHVRLLGNTLTMTAADGFRLSVCRKRLDWNYEAESHVEALIPAKTLNEVKRISDAKGDSLIKIHLAENRVLFEIGDTKLYSQLIGGTFPDPNQIIPKECTTTVTLGVADFAASLKGIAVFARDVAGGVTLAIGENSLQLRSPSSELGEGESVMDAEVDGDGLEIAFNAKYLLDALGVIGSEKVVMEFTTPSSPGLMKIPGSDEFLYVLMPMHISK